MREYKYQFPLSAKLHPEDNENQTYGCRCINPDICKNCFSKSCGLTNEKHICTTPSRAWKNIYKNKIEQDKQESNK